MEKVAQKALEMHTELVCSNLYDEIYKKENNKGARNEIFNMLMFPNFYFFILLLPLEHLTIVSVLNVFSETKKHNLKPI